MLKGYPGEASDRAGRLCLAAPAGMAGRGRGGGGGRKLQRRLRLEAGCGIEGLSNKGIGKDRKLCSGTS